MSDRLIDLTKPTLVAWEKVEPQFAEVWNSGRLTVGPQTERFEKTAAELMGVKHVVAVSSCTSGLMLVVRALGLTGEVILPSFTWTSTGHALIWNGVTPIFADIAPGVYTLDPLDVKKRITKNTSAIFATNTFGLYPDMNSLQAVADEAGIPLLSDSAQAIGAKYDDRIGGGLGLAEIFSLSPTKVVTAVEGGLITTDDDSLARQVRQMRDYGKTTDGSDIELFGLSARISEFHSIVGWENLKLVEKLIETRAKLVARYRANLAEVTGIEWQLVPAGYRSSHNYLVMFLDPARYDRDTVWREMAARKVQTKRYFYPPVHKQAIYRNLIVATASLPVTEAASDAALALPLYTHMSEDDVDLACARLREILC